MEARSEPDPAMAKISAALDVKAGTEHRQDALNLLTYSVLLIITILFIWGFKHRRLRFVHETGLAIIFGLITGVIIRYSSYTGPTYEKAILEHSENRSEDNLPDYVQLEILSDREDVKNSSYLYKFDKRMADSKFSEYEEKATFDPELFFNVMLPPIIFYAGFSMKRRHFFRNFGSIMTFAFFGTVISCLVVGTIMYGFMQLNMFHSFTFSDCLFFGAIISATDPVTVLAIFNELHVDVDLYALVFGESVMNDAVALVLSKSVEAYDTTAGKEAFDTPAFFSAVANFVGVFAGSFLIGVGFGFACALCTKFTALRDYPLLETTLFFILSYASFLAAEAANLTGIVAILFCGICQAHYTFNNLSEESQQRTKQLFEFINFLMENFIFSYIGVSMFTIQRHEFNFLFIFASLLAIVVARACVVYPLTFLLNLGRKNRIPTNFQHMMMFSGLRGAIAFALALRSASSPERYVIMTTTAIIVMLTVILCGGTTTAMLNYFKIRVGVSDEDMSMRSIANTRTYNSTDSIRSIDSMGPNDPNPAEAHTHQQTQAPKNLQKSWAASKWYHVDSRFFKPLLTNHQPSLMVTLPSCCLPLGRLLTTEAQMSNRLIDNQEVEIASGRPDGGFGRSQQQQQFPRQLGVESDDVGILTLSDSVTNSSLNGGGDTPFASELATGDLGDGGLEEVATFGNGPNGGNAASRSGNGPNGGNASSRPRLFNGPNA